MGAVMEDHGRSGKHPWLRLPCQSTQGDSSATEAPPGMVPGQVNMADFQTLPENASHLIDTELAKEMYLYSFLSSQPSPTVLIK